MLPSEILFDSFSSGIDFRRQNAYNVDPRTENKIVIIGIQMKRKEQTKTFMLISVSIIYIQIFQRFKGKKTASNVSK